MNNEQMISAPRELLKRALEDVAELELQRQFRGSVYINKLSDKLRALLAQPAAPWNPSPDLANLAALLIELARKGIKVSGGEGDEPWAVDLTVHPAEVTGGDVLRWMDEHAAAQHQGEPVALPARKEVPEPSNAYEFRKGWNACLDEIAKLGPLYTRPQVQHQGQPVAWADPKDLVEDGYGHSFGVSSSQYPGRVPLYTHSDPGEVERLRMLEHGLRVSLQTANDHTKLLISDRDTLRAQLAERDALLRFLKSDCEKDPMYVGPSWIKRIDAALSSGSAENEELKFILEGLKK